MPLLTLTSDIGNRDYLVSAVKAELYKVNEDFRIVDISHQVPPFNYLQAAYVCRSAVKHFPEYSYHIILVNLFETKPKQLLLAFHQNQYYLCADNGLLQVILEEKPEMVMGIPLDEDEEKSTLYLVKVFGETINQLINGKSIQQIGMPDVNYVEKHPVKPFPVDNGIEGQIIFIDNFENVIVNITRSYFEEQRRGRNFKIIFKRDEKIDKISETYADVHEGEKLALFNSAGYLEIAINKGNAAGLFGLKGFSERQQASGMQNQLFYQTVRIFFED
jgi:S-adenosylmethionine hydrolase